MKIIGLTGGMGSGKSTVARMFEALGVPVYYADDRAKWLMANSSKIKEAIIDEFGAASYVKEKLNRTYLAQRVFSNTEKLKSLNEIVHPAVKEDFKFWVIRQKSPYVIQENPLIFENQDVNNFDAIISVVADEELRIQRIMDRDKHSRAHIIDRFKNQTSDAVRRMNSDFIIENKNMADTEAQVMKIHKVLLAQIP